MQIKNNKVLLSLLVVAGLAISLILSVYGISLITNVTQKASSTIGNSMITLSPASGNYVPGKINSVAIAANIPTNNNVDGIQIIANISGISPNLLNFSPVVPSNMKLIYNTISQGASTSSSVLKLIYISNSPTVPVVGSVYKLGALVFDSTKVNPNVKISFDTTLSKIAQNLTTNDILLPPQTENYFFRYPRPTESPRSCRVSVLKICLLK